jgi:hypothetical protein
MNESVRRNTRQQLTIRHVGTNSFILESDQTVLPQDLFENLFTRNLVNMLIYVNNK